MFPPVNVNNEDGFFSDLPNQLFAKSGGRAMLMGTLTKEEKVQAQIMLAELRI